MDINKVICGEGKSNMKRIGIYHFQYYVGNCKLCYRHFIQEMVLAYESCYETARQIYGEENCDFKHYTDFGAFSGENTDRPSFHRLEEAIEKDELDVLMCYRLGNITRNEDLLIELYKKVRAKEMDFITANNGLDAMKYLDLYIKQNHL